MSVRVLSHELEEDVLPHAIIWRPLRYFTIRTRDGQDDLDNFTGASFVIGNDIRFDLRSYREHPGVTVTLYLPDEIRSEERISEMLSTIFREMMIPSTAVAWQRGQQFEFGTLERQKGDRLRESEARLLVLKIASQQPGRSASTRFLKKEMSKYTEFSVEDLRRSKSRPQERIWQQIVGNVVSHRKSRGGPFAQGYAVKTETGLQVTVRGLHYLNSIGFSAFLTSDFSE